MPGVSDLRRIARRAMLERGFLPDFSAAVLAETEAIGEAAAAAGPSVRDLRGLLWASIDNDDSRDLDQLSVSEPLTDGAVRILGDRLRVELVHTDVERGFIDFVRAREAP